MTSADLRTTVRRLSVLPRWRAYTARRPFARDYIVWASVRAWALLAGLQLFPYPSGHALFDDVDLYDRWAHQILQGHFPIYDVKWQYPPLAAAVFVAGYVLSPHRIGFALVALAADFAIMRLLDRKARTAATRLPVYIWLATPILMGPIVLGRYDVFPTLFAVAALLAAGGWWAGPFWAVGGMLKMWPGLGLLSVKRGSHLKTGLTFVVTAFVGMFLVLQWFPAGMYFLHHEKDRGIQVESVAALPFMLWNAGPGQVRSEVQWGSLELIDVNSAAIGVVLTVSTAVLLGVIALWHIQGRLEQIPGADITLTVVLTAMVTSRVLSPQYNLWVMGIVAVCGFRPQPRYTRILVTLSASALAAQLLFPIMYSSFRFGGLLATAVHVARIYWLVTATVLCWRGIVERLIEPSMPRWRLTADTESPTASLTNTMAEHATLVNPVPSRY